MIITYITQTITNKSRLKQVTKLPPEITIYLQQKLDKYVEENKKVPSMEQFCRMIHIKYPYHSHERNQNPMPTPIIPMNNEGNTNIATKRRHSIQQSTKYPVWPLVIPNNCSYDAKTGKMTVLNQQRSTTLAVYKPVS